MTDVELARIAAGELRLSAPRARTQRVLRVEAFEIAVYPLTQEQLGELIGVTASHPRRPAVDISWHRAVRVCNALSEWEGLDSAYTVDGDEITWHPDSDGYRLPTEVEWEYACRAGSLAPQYGPVAEVAWTAADGVRSPQPVGGRHPNLFGLFDMLGNVWEWCGDHVDADRGDGHRVFRGGGFTDDAGSVRADARRGSSPAMHHDDVGMRLARGAVGSAAEPPSRPARRA